MLDIISVVLSAIGLLQSVKGRESLAEKAETLKQGSAQIRKIHDFLSEAKEVHDQFEFLNTYAIEDLAHRVGNPNANMHSIAQDLAKFLKQETEFVTRRTLTSRDADADAIDDSTPVRKNLIRLDAIHPEFEKSLDAYTASIDRMHALLVERNFGIRLQDATAMVRTQVHRITFNADQVIFNTIPIIIFMQYEMDNAIEALRS